MTIQKIIGMRKWVWVVRAGLSPDGLILYSTVKTLTYNVLKLFMEMDSQLFDQCAAQFLEREGK